MTPTLLIPGLAASGALYKEQIGPLSSFGPVHVADHRQADTMAGLAESILKTAPSYFRLCGLSMGGYIALEIMRQAPERVSALVLMDTSAHPDTAESAQKRLDSIALARKGQFLRLMKESIPNLVTEARALDPYFREYIVTMAEHCGVEGYINQLEACRTRIDSRPYLSAIDVPTLVLVGEMDKLTPEDLAEEIVDGIGENAELEVLQDAAHLTPIEQPIAVTAALSEFFAKVG